MNQAKVTLEFPTPAAAETAAASLEPDNDDLLACRVEGSTLHLEADSTSILGLLRTLDDALGCLRATGMD